jgi:hypothetical protein
MADFCQQCSIQGFGKDYRDLADITKKEDEAKDLYCVVLCEGCGAIQVDSEGRCISKDCLEKHNDDS